MLTCFHTKDLKAHGNLEKAQTGYIHGFLSPILPESLTSTMQLLAGDYIAQDVSVGFTWFLPAELQGIGAQGGEDQGARGTGSAQSKWRAYRQQNKTRDIVLQVA